MEADSEIPLETDLDEKVSESKSAAIDELRQLSTSTKEHIEKQCVPFIPQLPII